MLLINAGPSAVPMQHMYIYSSREWLSDADNPLLALSRLSGEQKSCLFLVLLTLSLSSHLQSITGAIGSVFKKHSSQISEAAAVLSAQKQTKQQHLKHSWRGNTEKLLTSPQSLFGSQLLLLLNI